MITTHKSINKSYKYNAEQKKPDTVHIVSFHLYNVHTYAKPSMLYEVRMQITCRLHLKVGDRKILLGMRQYSVS